MRVSNQSEYMTIACINDISTNYEVHGELPALGRAVTRRQAQLWRNQVIFRVFRGGRVPCAHS
jgi:hypothetical protein